MSVATQLNMTLTRCLSISCILPSEHQSLKFCWCKCHSPSERAFVLDASSIHLQWWDMAHTHTHSMQNQNLSFSQFPFSLPVAELPATLELLAPFTFELPCFCTPLPFSPRRGTASTLLCLGEGKSLAVASDAILFLQKCITIYTDVCAYEWRIIDQLTHVSGAWREFSSRSSSCNWLWSQPAPTGTMRPPSWRETCTPCAWREGATWN